MHKRLLGLSILLPFFFFGYGSYLMENASDNSAKLWALILISLNSISVLGIAFFMRRTFLANKAMLARIYSLSRVIEAALLFTLGLSAFFPIANEWSGWLYPIAMLVLALPSIYIFGYLRKEKLIKNYLGLWAQGGYTLLAMAMLFKLLGSDLSDWLVLPGGLFELYWSISLIFSERKFAYRNMRSSQQH